MQGVDGETTLSLLRIKIKYNCNAPAETEFKHIVVWRQVGNMPQQLHKIERRSG